MQLSLKPFNAKMNPPLLALFAIGFILVLTLVWEVYSSLTVTGVIKQEEEATTTATNPVMTQNNGTAGQWPLFGTAEIKPQIKINTQYILLGVLITDKPNGNRAIIAEPNKDAEVYSMGDKISPDLSIYRVYNDRVELMRYGKIETLYLNWQEENTNPVISQPGAIPNNNPAVQAQQIEEMKARWSKFRNPNGQGPDAATIEQMRQQAIQNAQTPQQAAPAVEENNSDTIDEDTEDDNIDNGDNGDNSNGDNSPTDNGNNGQ